jgi:hypothetical protein
MLVPKFSGEPSFAYKNFRGHSEIKVEGIVVGRKSDMTALGGPIGHQSRRRLRCGVPTRQNHERNC